MFFKHLLYNVIQFASNHKLANNNSCLTLIIAHYCRIMHSLSLEHDSVVQTSARNSGVTLLHAVYDVKKC
jgi:hypothetical protein